MPRWSISRRPSSSSRATGARSPAWARSTPRSATRRRRCAPSSARSRSTRTWARSRPRSRSSKPSSRSARSRVVLRGEGRNDAGTIGAPPFEPPIDDGLPKDVELDVIVAVAQDVADAAESDPPVTGAQALGFGSQFYRSLANDLKAPFDRPKGLLIRLDVFQRAAGGKLKNEIDLSYDVAKAAGRISRRHSLLPRGL